VAPHIRLCTNYLALRLETDFQLARANHPCFGSDYLQAQLVDVEADDGAYIINQQTWSPTIIILTQVFHLESATIARRPHNYFHLHKHDIAITDPGVGPAIQGRLRPSSQRILLSTISNMAYPTALEWPIDRLTVTSRLRKYYFVMNLLAANPAWQGASIETSNFLLRVKLGRTVHHVPEP
jgi:hypothetical protein